MLSRISPFSFRGNDPPSLPSGDQWPANGLTGGGGGGGRGRLHCVIRSCGGGTFTAAAAAAAAAVINQGSRAAT